MPRKQNSNATQWTPERNRFLKANFRKLTNQELADGLGLTLTVVRNQTRALGLRRYDFDNWTAEEVAFLQENYHTLGDVEIMDHMMANRPERSPMQRKAIRKKRLQLGLHRSAEQIAVIRKRHSQPGGRADTISQNSASVKLTDGIVAGYMSREGMGINSDLKKALMANPALIELKRTQIQLNRTIKEIRNAKA